MPATIRGSIYFCGNELSAEDLGLIRQIVGDFPALSIWELAGTICELLDWRRPNGTPKTRECFSFLQQLRERGWLDQLPTLQVTCPRGPRAARVDQTTDLRTAVTGSLGDYLPLQLELITTRTDRQLFQQHLQSHHYLGYRVPVGAQLRYFVRSQQGKLLACLLFTSAAWRMAARDKWIGWDDSTRSANLSLIANNSRFLILPWVRIPSLASHILSMCARQLPDDWQSRYRLRPVLLETLVDQAQFAGTCYRAANWIEVGATKGRGRMDRFNDADRPIKLIFLYPLLKHARRVLCQAPNGGPQ